MKQRIVFILLCVALVLCLAACGGTERNAADGTEPAAGGAVNGAAMVDITINISVIYPENITEEVKSQYGLLRLDESYAPLDETVYGDGESIVVYEGELARFMAAPIDGFLPAIRHSAGTVLGQELNGGAYITVTEATGGVMDVTVDYANESAIGRIQGPAPASEEASDEASDEASGEAGSAASYTVRFLGLRYPDGHDAGSDPGGIRVYEELDDWSVYTDYTEPVEFEMAAGETFNFSILPTRANTGVGYSGGPTAILTDDLPRYVIESDTDLEIVYSEPGPVSIGPAREDICFTVEVLYPEGISEEDKANYGLQQLDSDMKPMEDRVYGDGDTFTVSYTYWAGFAPLKPELAELCYTEAVAYTIYAGDIPCTIFRSAENGEVTITVDYSGE